MPVDAGVPACHSPPCEPPRRRITRPPAASVATRIVIPVLRIVCGGPLWARDSLWREQGKSDDAHTLLAEIYGWFTEGFATRDLQTAKALLDDLA
jgi:hypothetical protein